MTSRAQILEKVHALLAKAETEKQQGYKQAILVLVEAAALIPQLNAEQQAEKHSTRNVSENKSTQEILYYSKRGNIYYECGIYDEALKCYQTVKSKLQGNNKVYKAIGDTYRKQRKFKEAIAEYNDGLDIMEEESSPSQNDKAAIINSKGLTYLDMEDYDKAIECFNETVKIAPENPLYLCNKGRALHAKNSKDEKAYLDCFEAAQKIVAKPDLRVEGLTELNITTIRKTLDHFIKKVKELNEVKLSEDDDVLEARARNAVGKEISKLAGGGIDEGAAVSALDQVKKTKMSLKELQKQPNLKQFYDGFLYTLCQSYTTSVVVDSGTFVIDTGSTVVTVTKTLVSMIPFCGSQISEAIGVVADFVKTAKVTKAAANVAKFATEQDEFKNIVQDAVIEIMNERCETINNLKKVDAQELGKWKARFRKVMEKYAQFEEFLYGARMETNLQKLGSSTANDLLCKWISSGKIYGGRPAIEMSEEDKHAKLVESGLDILDKGIEEQIEAQVLKVEKPETQASKDDKPPTNQPNKVSGGNPPNQAAPKNSCCTIF
eukprot:CAMPEP_0176449930 /NCGR_PEP_ID=MMETSP0127-20121128/26814_1 /TAXON_ID=938130 /ORGANISM="Platyophrya macrostoma, Strain WH" /LENGTH=547 /DNA_ID=CAMNT_0017837449 /DNA_START=14 /DNA_END=1657 /DNA_ORIENTATION=-